MKSFSQITPSEQVKKKHQTLKQTASVIIQSISLPLFHPEVTIKTA